MGKSLAGSVCCQPGMGYRAVGCTGSRFQSAQALLLAAATVLARALPPAPPLAAPRPKAAACCRTCSCRSPALSELVHQALRELNVLDEHKILVGAVLRWSCWRRWPVVAGTDASEEAAIQAAASPE